MQGQGSAFNASRGLPACPDQSIVDSIYEAAFVPEIWPQILDHMAAAVTGHGTALFNPNEKTPRAISSASLAELDTKMVTEGWLQRNTRADRLLTIQHQGFVDEAKYVSPADYQAEPIFTEVLDPLGYGFGASTFITGPSGDKIIFAVEKKKSTGPITAEAIRYLDQLRPHLARATLMSSRLAFERINTAMAALQLSGLPAAMLSASGTVLGTNPLLEALEPQLMIAAHNSIRFQHVAANDILLQALQAFKLHGGLAGRSFPLPHYEECSPAVVHLVAIEGHARDIFSQAAFLMVVTPIDRSKVPSAETIQGLFDLTAAEAKVARELASGSNVANAAQDLSVSQDTVRTHIKAILAKSGMSRQTDFVAAIASIRTITG
ncbi:LuxR C-terminal-related transcriptional regulator [Rhizobium lemnae]|uniref:Helix-turn-helix transcriptional regulator n=1 Tax=Rhizobium lemnae TaxID=1214924 RepID=A0ABV8E679_9HYPH|nr:LuxR C-terminal-related transcriptional regulator [Rhizobium lemnae]MCJ8508224.1 LuxR C-terminal-related transcriptional regulator [Rhizobium lemnae]